MALSALNLQRSLYRGFGLRHRAKYLKHTVGIGQKNSSNSKEDGS